MGNGGSGTYKSLLYIIVDMEVINASTELA